MGRQYMSCRADGQQFPTIGARRPMSGPPPGLRSSVRAGARAYNEPMDVPASLPAMPLAERLLACGVRPTSQRLRVAAMLLERPQHMTAEQILAALRSSGCRISKATIYNTLELFTRRGLCRRISSSPAPEARANNGVRYDADISEHAHVVTSSGKVMDLPDDLGRDLLRRLPADLLEEVHKRTGIRVGRVAIEFIEGGR